MNPGANTASVEVTPTFPAVGSIQWGINHGRCYQVDGIYKYGSMMANCESPQHAAASVLYKGETYSVWVPPATVLTVWLVTGGSCGGYHMRSAERFIVQHGQPIPLVGCLNCGRDVPEGKSCDCMDKPCDCPHCQPDNDDSFTPLMSL
jgi:hypothetical protein